MAGIIPAVTRATTTRMVAPIATRTFSSGFRRVVSSFFGNTPKGGPGPRVIQISDAKMKQICDRNFERKICADAERLAKEAKQASQKQ